MAVPTRRVSFIPGDRLRQAHTGRARPAWAEDGAASMSVGARRETRHVGALGRVVGEQESCVLDEARPARSPLAMSPARLEEHSASLLFAGWSGSRSEGGRGRSRHRRIPPRGRGPSSTTVLARRPEEHSAGFALNPGLCAILRRTRSPGHRTSPPGATRRVRVVVNSGRRLPGVLDGGPRRLRGKPSIGALVLPGRRSPRTSSSRY